METPAGKPSPAGSQVVRYLANGTPVPLHYLTYLFEHVADVIFFLEVLGGDRYRFSAVNERFTETTGMAVADVVGREVDDIIPPSSLALVKGKYRQAIETRQPMHWQEVSDYPTGTKTGEVTVSPVIDGDGECRLLMGVVHDVTAHHEQRLRLAQLEERWRLALDYAGAGAWEWQADTGLLSILPARLAALDLEIAPLRATRENLLRRVHPDDAAALEAAFAPILNGASDRLDVEARLRHRDGRWVWLRAQGKVELDAARRPLRMLGTVTDASAEKATQHRLELGALVFENSHEAIAVIDPAGRIQTVNPAFTRMRGYTCEEIAGKAQRLYNAGLDDAGFYDALWAQLRATGQWQGELWSRHKDGHVIAEYRTITAAYGPDKRVRNYIEIGADITESRRAEELAWRQGNYDALTGLPNRHLFLERLREAIDGASHGGDKASGSFTLLAIDLDRFKDVNETLGHSVGDEILKKAAQRLLDCTREADTVARLGGDEFTVLLMSAQEAGRDDLDAATGIASAIIDAMTVPFDVNDETLHLSASVGITHYPKDAADLESLVKHADQAMYMAKEQGRNRYAYFSRGMQERAQARRQLIKDLRNAIAGRELHVCYQPIVNLRSGALEKAESLVRWRHPLRGSISPAEFVPLSEETGLIVDLGEQVFETVVQDVAAWQREYDARLQVSINVSPMQLLSGHDACERCFRMAHAAGLPERTLVIEVTESMLLDNNPLVVQQLRQIAENGMELALDDFGTGYSSLSYLKKFKFDLLKIDRSFVMHLEADTTDRALCETIVTMAHKLGMRVIAEGVETPEQLRLLKKAGCDYGQGFLFSRAVPAQTISGWLGGGALPWMQAGFASAFGAPTS